MTASSPQFMTCTFTDSFVPAVLALHNSMLAHHDNLKLGCLITSGVSAKGKQQLKSRGITVYRDNEPVEDILPIGDFDHRWRYSLEILKMYRLVDIPKFVFLAPDAMANDCLDDLIHYPNFAAVKNRGPQSLLGGRYYFNTGCIVVEPSQGLFDAILDSAPATIELHQRHGIPFGDQHILNHFVPDWPDRDGYEIPVTCNMFFSSLYEFLKSGHTIEREPSKEHIRFIHFTGPRKPWSHREYYWFKVVIRPIMSGHRPRRDVVNLLRRYFSFLPTTTDAP